MDALYLVAFVVYPYVVITTFVLGHSYRYATDRFGWNTRSTEILDRGGLRVAITAFHWGILMTLFGHAGGLLIPQRVYDAFGIDAQIHTRIAVVVGILVGILAFVGVSLLLKRRLTQERVKAVTGWNQAVTLILLFLAIGTGLYNVFFGGYNVLGSVAPWIRSIVILRPDPSLLQPVPLSYKIHIVFALAILGFSPFTRLVHIWSVPIAYLVRRYILFRN
jgi:nitrate reductase gamma subunit